MYHLYPQSSRIWGKTKYIQQIQIVPTKYLFNWYLQRLTHYFLLCIGKTHSPRLIAPYPQNYELIYKTKGSLLVVLSRNWNYHHHVLWVFEQMTIYWPNFWLLKHLNFNCSPIHTNSKTRWIIFSNIYFQPD